MKSVRFYSLLIILLLCFSCCEDEERSHAQTEQMCLELANASRTMPWKELSPKMDSILARSRELPENDQYAVLIRAVRTCRERGKEKDMEKHLKELSNRPFPKITNKRFGLLLMDMYAYGLVPQEMNIPGLSALLFEMENRFRLTPQQRCRFLTLKAGIYTHCFLEYESAVSIADEAAALARKNNLPGDVLFSIYKIQKSCYNRLGNREKKISVSRELLDSADRYGLDPEAREMIYRTLCMDYLEMQQYEKAYAYWKKAGIPAQGYQETVSDMLLESNHLGEALAYLDDHRDRLNASFAQGKITATVQHLLLGKITWTRAKVYLRQGDSVRYEQYMTEAIGYYDRESPRNIDVNHCSLSEAYARWLWQHGQRDQAIRRMEMVTRKLTRPEESFYSSGSFQISQERLERLRLLVDYYRQARRPADALRQLVLCDSLTAIYQNTLLEDAKHKISQRIYTDELHRNLELRSAAYRQQRHKTAFALTLLGFALAICGTFIILYYRRKKELNAIYARQKEIEQMKMALLALELDPKAESDLPADKRLYLRMEKQMYAEKLFLNPNFSRNDLCRMVGSNRMYVSTSINKYAGMNINQWINKARINHAIRLIRLGETHPVNLAKESGFCSASAFYRNFKEVTMLTPTQYIERERKNAESDNPA